MINIAKLTQFNKNARFNQKNPTILADDLP